MNRLTSQQRKLVYLVAILVLLVPIIGLGMPASGRVGAGPSAEEVDSGPIAQGGMLARLRRQHDLGESTLGNVDPTSSTMNLVLLGMRGVAANLLWMDAIRHQERKNWARVRSDVDSIILLQPHFTKVWIFQGWNLAYNVSAEWDAVPDRYYWVKEGAKFIIKGTERNEKSPELYWWVGRILGEKVGRSDEWRMFRKYFNPSGYPGDPDAGDPNRGKYADGLDRDVNPQGKDNYLAAKVWYHRANKVEHPDRNPQHIMARYLFRQKPARSQFDYADALQREGKFEEESRLAWEVAFRDWTDRYLPDDLPGYGQELFRFEHYPDGSRGELKLEATEQAVQELAEKWDIKPEIVQHWAARYQDTTNYRYWRTRALVEQENQMVQAHRKMYQGQQELKSGNLGRAKRLLESGMEDFAYMLLRHPNLSSGDLPEEAVEEGLTALVLWRYICGVINAPIPQEYPLKPLWEQYQPLVPEIQERLKREFKVPF